MSIALHEETLFRKNGTAQGLDLKVFSFPSAQVAEIDVTYKRVQIGTQKLPQVHNPADAYAIFKEIWDDDKLDYCEQLNAIFLDSANRLLGWSLISEGVSNRTTIFPQKIFGLALRINATSIIIAHNHTSGSLVPSQSDLAITQRLMDGAELIGLKLLDHLVVTRNANDSSGQGFISIKEYQGE